MERTAAGDRRATDAQPRVHRRLGAALRAAFYRRLAEDDDRAAYWVRHVRIGVLLSEIAAVGALGYLLVVGGSAVALSWNIRAVIRMQHGDGDSDGLTRVFADVAAELVGEPNVERERDLIMASEDFSFMLEARPGAYINIGNGSGDGGCEVHNPVYDFNDAALPLGASFFARLIETRLAA